MPTFSEIGQRAVGLGKPVVRRRHLDAVPSGQGQEFLGIGTGVGGDRTDLAATESVQPESSAGRKVCAHQGAVADDAGAEQRRQFGIGVTVGQAVSESSRDSGEFGVAAVGVPAGVAGVRA